MSLALILQGVNITSEVLGLKICVAYKVFTFVIIKVVGCMEPEIGLGYGEAVSLSSPF